MRSSSGEGVDPERGFTQPFRDGGKLDASNLMVPIAGFVAHEDPRARAALERIAEELSAGGFVYRYVTDGVDGLSGDEATFAICSFWLVECMARAGQTERARELFERLIGFCNDVGLLAERSTRTRASFLVVLARAYEEQGFPDEMAPPPPGRADRLHGPRGLRHARRSDSPSRPCAVAWNPSSRAAASRRARPSSRPPGSRWSLVRADSASSSRRPVSGGRRSSSCNARGRSRDSAAMGTFSFTDAVGSPFVVHDPSFADVLGDASRLVRVVETDAHEGPVYAAGEDALYFTTLPRRGNVPAPGFPEVAIKRLALDGDELPVEPDRVTVVRERANAANGMTLDLEGRLVVCEQGTHAEHARISRLDPATGAVETVVDAWRGLRLNSPNDVVVKGDGTVWFTDPSYGHLQGFKPEPLIGDYVYRYDPRSGRLTVVADGLDKPNGLAFSPDESVLYVGDSGANQEAGSYYPTRPHHVLAYDVRDGRRLTGERLFAVTTPGFPDGLKVDRDGRVYASAFSGVQVFDPSGGLIGEIALPGAVNFTFGGPDRNVLFITTDTAVWAAVLDAKGA